MYYIYLYSDHRYSKFIKEFGYNEYGYWTGKSYTVQGERYPVCENNEYKRKGYKSLKRAISSGEGAIEKYGYVDEFDIKDEGGNVIYKSYEISSEKSKMDSLFARNDVIYELNQIDNKPENRKRTIQVAIKYIEEVPGELSDVEINKYLKNKYPDKEFQWCDGEKDIFEDFP